jgi:hypothetical protein
MVSNLVQDDNTVCIAIFLHDQPKVSGFGYQFPIRHWSRKQPHDLLKIVPERSFLHGSEGIRAERGKQLTCGLRISDNPSSDNLTPQATTTQDPLDMGPDGASLSCPGSSVVADVHFPSPDPGKKN